MYACHWRVCNLLRVVYQFVYTLGFSNKLNITLHIAQIIVVFNSSIEGMVIEIYTLLRITGQRIHKCCGWLTAASGPLTGSSSVSPS